MQIKGCVMGTKCARSYADIFMVKLDERYIYPLIKAMSKFYLRFIDDIFFLTLTGIAIQLMKFKQQINKIHTSIKPDLDFSHKEINFLAVVYKTQSGQFQPNST